MKIGFFLFEGITALDVVGPYEVLSRLHDAEVFMFGLEKGTIRTDNKLLALQVDHTLEDCPQLDLLLVPGGWGVERLRANPKVVKWVQQQHQGTQWTTSVCTGSLLLGEAGILKGKRATTHWAFYPQLAELGAEPIAERIVYEDKIVTAAGVSAGIDMALSLAAKITDPLVAQAIQLGIEYDPQPPFNSGSPKTAPAPLVKKLQAHLQSKR